MIDEKALYKRNATKRKKDCPGVGEVLETTRSIRLLPRHVVAIQQEIARIESIRASKGVIRKENASTVVQKLIDLYLVEP